MKGKIVNLVFDKWIPVVRADGCFSQASLLDVFSSDSKTVDLVVRPHERIALMRLFICIASAALDGPESIWDFDGVEEELPKKASQYLKKWSDCFNLYDVEKPFLQNINIIKPSKKDVASVQDDKTPVTKMDFSLATGNNSTFFDHPAITDGKRCFGDGEIALSLITFLCFSPGGLISKVLWDGKETSSSSKHALCTPSSMLHSFIRQDTLVGTIASNVLSKDQVKSHYGQYDWGRPVWEVMPHFPSDEQAIINATSTYLGRLMPLSRLVLLSHDRSSMLLGDGLEYPSFKEKINRFPSEPSATVVLSYDKSDTVLLGANLDKAIWRELHALAVKKNGGEGGALALSRLPDHESYDLWVGAFVTDKATILDTMESVFHLPSAMQEADGLNAYRSEVEYAEGMARKLGWAVETYRQHSDGGWEGRVKSAGPKKNDLFDKLKSKAMTFYWTAVEKRRDLLMAYVEASVLDPESTQVGKSSWRAAVEKNAADAYRLACGPQTARQLRAFALGQEKIKSANNGGIQESAVTISEVSE